MTTDESLVQHRGGCHCGAVSFTVTTPRRVVVQRCNCSICAPCGFVHLIVPASRFHLRDGGDRLTEYQFGTRTARHLFCNRCGVKSFYIPRSNPDGYSVNFNCLHEPDFNEVRVEDIDGQNWEKAARHLAGLSKED